MHVRIGVGLLIAALVVSGLGPPILLLFALLDVLGVTWTGLTMRRDGRGALSRSAQEVVAMLPAPRTAQA